MVKSVEKPVVGGKTPAAIPQTSVPSTPQPIAHPAKPPAAPVEKPVAAAPPPPPAPRAKSPVSRVLSVSEYSEDSKHRKVWEIESIMAVLKYYGILGDTTASVLSTGAGTEATPFLIAPHVQWVFMTDLYLDMTPWSTWSQPGDILRNPEVVFPHDTPLNVIPMHMDMRELKFPDNSFDAVFCTSSIEHLDSLADVHKAAKEIGRVLRPGGVAIVVTEFKVDGEGNKFDNVLLFTENDLRSDIVKPSGLTLVEGGEDAFTVDNDTLATEWALGDIIEKGKWPEVEGVLSQKGFKFTSVCLIMTKAEDA